MLRLFKNVAKGFVDAAVEYLQLNDFVERLLGMERDAALQELRAKVIQLNDTEYIALRQHLSGMMDSQRQKIAQARSGDLSVQPQELQHMEMRFEALRFLVGSAAEIHDKVSSQQSTTTHNGKASPARLETTGAPANRVSFLSGNDAPESMNDCANCIWLRPLKQASKLLEEEVKNHYTDAAIANALVEIGRDEERQLEAESQDLTQKTLQDDENWNHRPVMSAYCGLRETENIYLVKEVKNNPPSRICNDHRTELAPTRSCSDCQYRSTPRGPINDNDLARLNMRAMMDLAGPNASPKPFEDNLSRLHQNIGPRIAQELIGAYRYKGRFPMEPQYLRYCKYFQERDGDYRICCIQNPYNACPAWTRLRTRTSVELREQPEHAKRAKMGTYTFYLGHESDPTQGSIGTIQSEYLTVIDRRDLLYSYPVARIPKRKWVMLGTGRGASLPLCASKDRGIVKIEMDPAPSKHLKLLEPVKGPWRFEFELIAESGPFRREEECSHPTSGHRARVRYDHIRIFSPLTNEVKKYSFPGLHVRQGRWVKLKDAYGQLPLKVILEGGLLSKKHRVLIEWQPLDHDQTNDTD